MFTPDADLVQQLRALLAQGRYQDVLDRVPELESGGPAVVLAVATAATRLGRLADGERLAQSALADFRARADDDGRLRTLNLLGAILFERGRAAEAAKHWAGALEIGRALGDTLLVARASNNLASALHFEGRVEAARSGFREALLAYQRLADRRGIAETCHNLAIACRLEGDAGGAADLSAEAVRHAEVVGDPVLMALILTGQARTQLELNEFALAGEALDRSERLARETGDDLGVAEVELIRAERWLREGEPGRALECALAAKTIAEKHDSALLRGECAGAAARASSRLGRKAEARAWRAEAERIFTQTNAVLYLERLNGE